MGELRFVLSNNRTIFQVVLRQTVQLMGLSVQPSGAVTKSDQIVAQTDHRGVVTIQKQVFICEKSRPWRRFPAGIFNTGCRML